MSGAKQQQKERTRASHEHSSHDSPAPLTGDRQQSGELHASEPDGESQSAGPQREMPSGSWQKRLRASGYRLTPQRQLVLEAIADLGHATPDEIVSQVRKVASGVNVSTVYRTLDLLEQLALVTHTHLGHGAPTYHVAHDAGHVHLVCRECGRVSEVSPDVVAPTVELLAAEHGFEADVHHFAVFGRCAACRERPEHTDDAHA